MPALAVMLRQQSADRFRLTDGCMVAASPGDRTRGRQKTKDGNSMRRRAYSWRVLVVCALVAATGCSPTQPFYLHEDGDLSHYIDKATAAEHPDLDQLPLAEVENAAHPLTLSNPNFKEFWELTLEECVSIALANTKVIRGGSPVN